MSDYDELPDLPFTPSSQFRDPEINDEDGIPGPSRYIYKV